VSVEYRRIPEFDGAGVAWYFDGSRIVRDLFGRCEAYDADGQKVGGLYHNDAAAALALELDAARRRVGR
jgi:hypothetical protein